MKLFLALFIGLTCFFTSGCRSKQKGTLPVKQSDSSKFFPVNDIILEDIGDVDKTAYYIYRITTGNHIKRDSSAISFREFRSIANSFLDKNINTPSLKQEYQESVFHDLSLNSITIAYSTENDKLPVSDVTVLLDDKTNKVKRIFISTFYRRNDSTFREKYFWKAGKSFQINQSITTPANEIIEESTFIAWNDPDRK